MTSKQVIDLCATIGVGVVSAGSSMVDAQADRVRRHAEEKGLKGEPIVDKPKRAKKAATGDEEAKPKTTRAKKTTKSAASDTEAAPETQATSSTTPAESATTAPVAAPSAAVSPLPPATVVTSVVTPPAAPTASTPPSPTTSSATSPTSETAPTSAPISPAPRVVSSRPGNAITSRPPASRPPTTPGAPVPPPGTPPSSGPRTVPAGGRVIPPPPGGSRVPPPPARRPPGPDSRGPRPGGAPRPGASGRMGRFSSSSLGRSAPRPSGAGARPGAPGPRPAGGRGSGLGRQIGGPQGRGPNARGGGNRRGARKKTREQKRKDMEQLQSLQPTQYAPSNAPVPEGPIVVERGSSAQVFAPKLNRGAADVVRFLLEQGEMVTAAMSLADEQMELFAMEVGAEVILVDPGQQEEMELQALFDDSDDADESAQETRPPIVTIMGHVDHGKTTLLDKIRSANVVAGEAGGITQHIGAYQVTKNDKLITFIDTPGHAAFSKMRARGAGVTDIVVLVVAADDGVMPQTIEAISHARAADVPIIVAINKIDKENADVQRTMSAIAEQGLVPEQWGGDTIVVEMSAQQSLGIDDLLEQLLVVAEVEELTANPSGRAKGFVLEARLDVGRGPVATVLVDKGTLKVGDPMVAGAAWGRVRAINNDRGEQIKEAGPSSPVQVLGLSAVPQAGDEFRIAPDDRTARTVADSRAQRQRLLAQRGDARTQKGVKLEDIFTQIQAGETATLNLLIKADVHGSLEAVTESLRKLERDDVKAAFVHRGVGSITENDITLAATTNATIIGFNVRPDRKVRDLAEAENVEIRTYEVIYKVIEDIDKAMKGLLAPEFEEVVTGEAEVRELFRAPKVGAVAGCFVRSGVITRGSKVRFLREGVIIWKGAINTLRRFKDDVKEVREGFECGISLTDFQDLKQGDIIETYDLREIERV
ncbi:MAG: translation initiation factor IF-2 [Ilumatobacteraceae bacterium]